MSFSLPGQNQELHNSGHIGLVNDVVSEILLVFSVLSSSLIILVVLRHEDRRKVRTRMILGLFVAHLWTSILLSIILAFSLSGQPPRTGTSLCLVSAVFVCMATWTEYIWTIALAVVTYCILLHPLSAITLILEKRWFGVTIAIYALSTSFGVLQICLYGAAYSGGFCFSKSDEARVFNAVTAFAPRALVFVIITVLYIRIHLYLRKGDLGVGSKNPLFQRTQFSQSVIARSIAMHHGAFSLRQHDAKGGAAVTPFGGFAILPLGKEDGACLEGDSGLPQELQIQSRLCKAELQGTQLRPVTSVQNPKSLKISTDVSFISSHPPSSQLHQPSMLPLPSNAHQLSLLPSPSNALSFRLLSRVFTRLSERVPSVLTPTSTSSCDSESTSRVRKVLPNSSPTMGFGGGPWGEHVNQAVGDASLPEHMGRNESVPNYLKRKAAILFLLFPLTYTILFAVSLARLIDDFTSSAPSQWLHTVARWTFFLQAPLDALTLVLAARKVNRQTNIAIH